MRILVKFLGWKVPSSEKIAVGDSCYAGQLWWELPPWRSKVVAFMGFRKKYIGEECGESSHVAMEVEVRASEKGWYTHVY